MVLFGQWVRLADIPTAVNAGGSLTFGKAGRLYAFCGGNTRLFYYYDINLNQWFLAPSPPELVGTGAALTSNWYVSGLYPQPATHIWALRGNNTQDFWMFDLVKDSWYLQPSVPAPVYGLLAYGSDENNDGTGGHYWVYTIAGPVNQTYYIYKYGPVAPPGGWPLGVEPRALPRWYQVTSLSSTPPPVVEVSSIFIHDGKLGGISDTLFYNVPEYLHARYSIYSNSWQSPIDFSRPLGPGSDITSTKGAGSGWPHVLFVSRGGNKNWVWYRYIGDDRWRLMDWSGLTMDVNEGGALTCGPTFPPFYNDRYALYLLVGGNQKGFFGIPESRIFQSEGGGQSAERKPIFNLRISPNPIISKIDISFSLPKEEEIEIKLYDGCGRLIRNLFSGRLSEGNHNLSCDRPKSGVYFLHLKTREEEVIEKIVVK